MVPKARLLADYLARYEGPLTADFQRVYGLRLVDAVTSREVEEVLDLVEWLPAGSALHATVQSEGNSTKARTLFNWDATQDLLLGIANLTSQQTYVLQQVNSPRKIPAPIPVPGPHGATPDGQKSGSATGMAMALLKAQKGG